MTLAPTICVRTSLNNSSFLRKTAESNGEILIVLFLGNQFYLKSKRMNPIAYFPNQTNKQEAKPNIK